MAGKNLPKISCPTCDREVDWASNPARPFCCDRCRLIDLGKWADEEYYIEGEKVPEDDTGDLL